MLEVWLTDVFKTREDPRIVFLLSTSSYPWCHDQGDLFGIALQSSPSGYLCGALSLFEIPR